MRLMAVQTGKDIVGGWEIHIRGLEGAFCRHTSGIQVPGINSIGKGCTVYVRVWAMAVIPYYSLHVFACVRVVLFILVAIHAEGHVIREIGAVGRAHIA
jgi:hypothetical protein